MEKLVNLLSGKKTILAATLAILLGVYMQNVEIIIIGLVSLGLRDAIRTNI